MWYVYILLCRDSSLYTGVTNNVLKRFHQHLCGQGAAYTRSHHPICVVYTQRVRTKSRALKREREIKNMKRSEKIALLHFSIV